SEAIGFAFSGSVDARLFTELDKAGRDELRAYFSDAFVKGERAEVRNYDASLTKQPSSDQIERLKANIARLTSTRLASARFKMLPARRAVLADGTAVYLTEVQKTLPVTNPRCWTFSGGIARRDAAGELHSLSTWSHLDCGEGIWTEYQPIAAFQRGAATCVL